MLLTRCLDLIWGVGRWVKNQILGFIFQKEKGKRMMVEMDENSGKIDEIEEKKQRIRGELDGMSKEDQKKFKNQLKALDEDSKTLQSKNRILKGNLKVAFMDMYAEQDPDFADKNGESYY